MGGTRVLSVGGTSSIFRIFLGGTSKKNTLYKLQVVQFSLFCLLISIAVLCYKIKAEMSKHAYFESGKIKTTNMGVTFFFRLNHRKTSFWEKVGN